MFHVLNHAPNNILTEYILTDKFNVSAVTIATVTTITSIWSDDRTTAEPRVLYEVSNLQADGLLYYPRY